MTIYFVYRSISSFPTISSLRGILRTRKKNLNTFLDEKQTSLDVTFPVFPFYAIIQKSY